MIESKTRHRTARRILLICLAVFIVSAGALGTYFTLALMPEPDYTSANFDVAYPLKPRQHIVINDGSTVVNFEIAEITKPDNDGCRRDENREVDTAASIGVSMSCFTRFDTILRVDNRHYRGVSLDEGIVDLSFPENGAYELIPYEVTITASSTHKTPNVTIHKLPKQVVRYGQAVTLKNGEIATLDGDDQTGIRVAFTTCGGVDLPTVSCLREQSYIHGEQPLHSLVSYDKKEPYKATPGNTVSIGKERIRVIDSDNTSYVTVIFEKNTR